MFGQKSDENRTEIRRKSDEIGRKSDEWIDVQIPECQCRCLLLGTQAGMHRVPGFLELCAQLLGCVLLYCQGGCSPVVACLHKGDVSPPDGVP